MKKIAILTMFYNSTNYGGVLQAYALQNFLNKYNEVHATQIKYYMNSGFSSAYSSKLITFNKITRKISKKKENNVYKKNKSTYDLFYKQKKDKFEEFSDNYIISSEKSYNYDELQELNTDYNYFICGSDQVWHSINFGYLLDFVEKPNVKFSYAASISRKGLSLKEKKKMSLSLKTFNAISVRENSDVELLQFLGEKKVEYVLDPTLLLNQNVWKDICLPRIHNRKYVLCYFLGNNLKAKKNAQLFANEKKLELIYIPANIYDIINFNKSCFGYNASPQEFLSLIYNAEYVFTDSYHCTIFSFIFQKQFIVFPRNSFDEMLYRLKNLMTIFNTSERLCVGMSRMKLSYILSLDKIDYEHMDLSLFENMKKHSIDFIETSLNIKNRN